MSGVLTGLNGRTTAVTWQSWAAGTWTAGAGCSSSRLRLELPLAATRMELWGRLLQMAAPRVRIPRIAALRLVC